MPFGYYCSSHPQAAASLPVVPSATAPLAVSAACQQLVHMGCACTLQLLSACPGVCAAAVSWLLHPILVKAAVHVGQFTYSQWGEAAASRSPEEKRQQSLWCWYLKSVAGKLGGGPDSSCGDRDEGAAILAGLLWALEPLLTCGDPPQHQLQHPASRES